MAAEVSNWVIHERRFFNRNFIEKTIGPGLQAAKAGNMLGEHRNILSNNMGQSISAPQPRGTSTQEHRHGRLAVQSKKRRRSATPDKRLSETSSTSSTNIKPKQLFTFSSKEVEGHD